MKGEDKKHPQTDWNDQCERTHTLELSGCSNELVPQILQHQTALSTNTIYTKRQQHFFCRLDSLIMPFGDVQEQDGDVFSTAPEPVNLLFWLLTFRFGHVSTGSD